MASARVGQARGACRAACPINCSNSARTVFLSSSDAALGNCAGSNGARKRTTHRPWARIASCPATAARIWRFNSDRVTERRAWRFGTTAPSQSPAGSTPTSATTGRAAMPATIGAASEHSSTAPGVVAAGSVDNSVDSGCTSGLAGALGRPATWCTAKCTLLAWEGVRSTRSKSADRKRRPITIEPARKPVSGRSGDGLRGPDACGPWHGAH